MKITERVNSLHEAKYKKVKGTITGDRHRMGGSDFMVKLDNDTDPKSLGAMASLDKSLWDDKRVDKWGKGTRVETERRPDQKNMLFITKEI